MDLPFSSKPIRALFTWLWKVGPQRAAIVTSQVSEVSVENSAILRTSRMMLATRADSPSLSNPSAAAGIGPSALALARISATVRAGTEARAD